MQSFMKMKKRTGMTESTRQVLNKAIDLLHRVSNKKLSEEAARRELSTALSTHFLSDGGIEENKKARLQTVLEEAGDVVANLESGKIPLYEAIMMVNRIVVSDVLVKKEEPTKIEPIQTRAKIEPYQDNGFIVEEFDSNGDQKEKSLSVKPREVPTLAQKKEEPEELSVLMNRVVLNKKQLEDSIVVLNGSLQTLGFELRPLKE